MMVVVAVLFRTKKKTKLSFVRNGVGGLFLCRGAPSSIARPGRDCATRDFVELIVVLVAFAPVFVDISARIARSLDLVWFSRNAPLRLVFDRKAKETAKDHPAPEEEDDFGVAAPKTVVVVVVVVVVVGPAARVWTPVLSSSSFASGMKAVVPT